MSVGAVLFLAAVLAAGCGRVSDAEVIDESEPTTSGGATQDASHSASGGGGGSGADTATASGGLSGPSSGGLSAGPPTNSAMGGQDGGVTIQVGESTVWLEPADPSIVTGRGLEAAAASTAFSERFRLQADWSFVDLELLTPGFVWALAQRPNEAVLLVFDTRSCDGPIGQIRVPEIWVQGRYLDLADDALLSCGEQECVVLEGPKLTPLDPAFLAHGPHWLARDGATFCVGDAQTLVCMRGDGVISESLPWSLEEQSRGALRDVGNCAVFATSQLCMGDDGVWRELPLAIAPPVIACGAPFSTTPFSTCHLPKEGLVPRGVVVTTCGTVTNTHMVTDHFFATSCECFIVG